MSDDGHLDKDGDEWTDVSYIFEVEQAELDDWMQKVMKYE